MQYERPELLLGSNAISRLRSSRVAVFGVGGVGGYVVEALARGGVGHIDVIDNDDVNETNINRQIIALHSTIGMEKVDAAADRIHDIDPTIMVIKHACFFSPEKTSDFDFSQYDYVVDAIDTITAKLALIEACKAVNTPVISAMGAGNKLDPTAFRVADISQTSVCPLARIMRKECKKRGIKKLKVVFSTEIPLEPNVSDEMIAKLKEEHPGKNALPGSVSFVPSVMGLIIGGEVIRDLTGFQR